MRIAAGRLLAALGGAALVGAAALAQTPTASAPPEKVVVVKLKYDPQKPDVPVGIETPAPDPVELSKGKGERAHWKLEPKGAGALHVRMKGPDAKPFKQHPGGSGAEAVSEAPTEGEIGKKYGYEVRVKLPGGKQLTLDPIIIVTP